MTDLALYRKLANTYLVNSSEDNAVNQFVLQSDKIWDSTLSTYDLLAPSKRGDDIEIVDRNSISVDSRGVFNYNKDFSKSTMSMGQERCFLAKDSAKIGYYINKVRTGQVFMVETLNNNKFLFEDTYVRECNSLLNWIDNNSVIHSFNCIREESSPTSLGASTNKYMTIADKENKVKVQSNQFTDLLRERDGLRFIFDEKCFKVYDIEREMPNGIVILSMEEDEINLETDKIITYDGNDIWIADYSSKPIFTVDITSDDIEIISASTVQLNTLITQDGQEVTKPITWTSSDILVATVDSNGLVTTIIDGVAAIRASMTDNLEVFDEIILTVTSVVSDNYTISVDPNIDGILLGFNETINTKLLNNNTDTTDTFTYSIIGGTALSSDYVFTIIDGNNFNIENLNNGKNIIVRCQSGIYQRDITLELKWFN